MSRSVIPGVHREVLGGLSQINTMIEDLGLEVSFDPNDAKHKGMSLRPTEQTGGLIVAPSSSNETGEIECDVILHGQGYLDRPTGRTKTYTAADPMRVRQLVIGRPFNDDNRGRLGMYAFGELYQPRPNVSVIPVYDVIDLAKHAGQVALLQKVPVHV